MTVWEKFIKFFIFGIYFEAEDFSLFPKANICINILRKEIPKESEFSGNSKA